LGLSALGLLACSEGSVSAPLGESQQPVLMQGNIYGGALPSKTVVLTYDDGPDQHTLELAKYLNEQGVKVTFFVNGKRFCKTWQGDVCSQPVDTRACNDGQAQAPVAAPIYYRESILDEIIALGHRIGNHTTDHCHLNGQDDPEDFAFELTTTQQIVDRHICDGLYLFRAPFGIWDGQAAALAQGVPELDKLVGPVNWDVDGGDWDCYQKGTSIQACGDGYLNLLDKRPGQKGIFLLHDRPEFNVGIDGPLKLAQYLVPKLKERGYAFSTLDELLDFQPQGPMACQPPTGGAGGAAGASGAGGLGGGGNSGNGGSGGAAGMVASMAGAPGVAGALGVGGAPGGAASGGAAPASGGAGGVGSGGLPSTPASAGTGSFASPTTENDASCQLGGGGGESRGVAAMLVAFALLARRRAHGHPRPSNSSPVRLKSLGTCTHISTGHDATASALPPRLP
jgi:peptidoglycan/xylan/chitin deacetylase (PgdA/CDA1 family)